MLFIGSRIIENQKHRDDLSFHKIDFGRSLISFRWWWLQSFTFSLLFSEYVLMFEFLYKFEQNILTDNNRILFWSQIQNHLIFIREQVVIMYLLHIISLLWSATLFCCFFEEILRFKDSNKSRKDANNSTSNMD